MAVASSDVTTVKVVLDAVLNSADTCAVSDPMPLALSALSGSITIANMLLDRGFNLNAPVTPSGLTPLMMAACNGHYSFVDWLLNKGANPNTVNAAYQTALDIAFTKRYSDIQVLLMKKMEAQNLTPFKSCSETIDLTCARTPVGYLSLFENNPNTSREDDQRVPAQFAEHLVPQFLVNRDLRTEVSPFSDSNVHHCYQQQNLLFVRSPCARSNCSCEFSENVSPFSAFSVHKCCNYSPRALHQRRTDFLSPAHDCMCTCESHDKDRLPRWDRRMSQSDSNLSKKDKKSLTKWWKDTTEKLHSKVKNKKRAFIRSKIVKTLKFGSDNCQGASEYINKAGKASGLFDHEVMHPCNSSFSTLREEKSHELKNFLLNCSLQEYFDIFIEHEVDIHTIYSLNSEDLEEMGIVSPRQQNKILKSLIISKRKM